MDKWIFGLSGLAVAVALSACVPAVDKPPAGTAFVEISEGSGFSGAYSMTIYADDTVMTQSMGPGGENPASRRAKGPEGAYARVSALLAAEGPKLAARLNRPGSEDACLDYGTDMILANPPVGRFSEVYVTCPNAEFDSFRSRVNLAVSAP